MAVARPLPPLESPVNEAEKPESKLLLLIALLLAELFRLRSSWINEFIAAIESTADAAEDVNGGEAAADEVLLLRLQVVVLADDAVANGTSATLGDSNGASCYGHCWNSCIGCLV